MGDTVLVKDHVKPQLNDIICFCVRYKLNKVGKLEFGEKYPQNLMIGQVVEDYITFKTTVLSEQNFTLKLSNVDYVGVVIQGIKNFKRG